MLPNWNIEQEMAHFQEIWCYRRSSHTEHTKETWNERAHEWEQGLQQDAERRRRSDERVRATADWLRSKGILGPEQEAIDIGCGPGRFVAEFAKTARHVVGTDLSDRMLAYGERYARSIGVENTSYVDADFQTADIDALNWRGRFDLVFSSITPAITGKTGLEKLMAISRAWCFNSCFVNFEDALEQSLVRELLGREPKAGWNPHWHWFYALFNLLLLDGYFPEVTYYREEKIKTVAAGEETARDYARRLSESYDGAQEETLIPRIKKCLETYSDSDGMIAYNDVIVYGWILWDIRNRVIR